MAWNQGVCAVRTMDAERGEAPLVGAHVSIAGGVWKAFARAQAIGANCFQVFLKSNVQWRIPDLADEDVERFYAERKRTGITEVVAHACYLVNPASPDRATRQKSVRDLSAELAHAERYGIKWLVLHPGNHLGSGVKRAVTRVAQVLGQALEAARNCGILLETTSGAGTAVGANFEEIAEIIAPAGGDRIGVCIDTAHVFAAGYDIASEEGFGVMKRRLAEMGLLRRIKVVHVNDSRAPLGSRVDRHAHIGKGHIGRDGFARIMRDEDLSPAPKILETPKGRCGRRDCDEVNIALLVRLAGV